MMGRPETVVVADGDKRSRVLVAQPLLRAGYETIEVESGAEALDIARTTGVALVVLEVALPDMTGYEVCRDPLGRVAALLLGADDFIVKPFEPAEFLARVQRLVSRRPQSPMRQPVNAPASAAGLTERESEILGLLAEGLRPKEIALKLSISPKTVGTHIQNLFGKVGVNSRAQLVAHAYRRELVGPT